MAAVSSLASVTRPVAETPQQEKEQYVGAEMLQDFLGQATHHGRVVLDQPAAKINFKAGVFIEHISGFHPLVTTDKF